jgi:hypothetical protein
MVRYPWARNENQRKNRKSSQIATRPPFAPHSPRPESGAHPSYYFIGSNYKSNDINLTYSLRVLTWGQKKREVVEAMVQRCDNRSNTSGKVETIEKEVFL